MNASPTINEWDWELCQRNQRGGRVAVWLVLALYPLFGVLDFLMAPAGTLTYLLTGRALVVLVSLFMLGSLRGQLFSRFPNLLSGVYMYCVGSGICCMIYFMGGLASPYYAGLNLVMLGCGLLFVWPAQVCYLVHGSLFVSWLIPNLLFNDITQPIVAVSNGLFMFATACIVTVGQVFNYERLRAQFDTQNTLIKAQEDLLTAHQKMQQLDAFKSRFFANITHELKTPLALILSSLELMFKGEMGLTLNEQRSSIGQMQKHGVKLLKLINDLLDLTKLEESRLILNVRQLTLSKWTRNLVDEIKPLAERKGIKVTFQSDEFEEKIWFDPDRLERVIVNLLSNAAKFTDAGGEINIQISEDRQPNSERVIISVSDTGRGFRPDQAKTIFDRFYQTDMGANRKYGGTGIGLALCQELVELHGGSIWAEGEEGVGATFYISLLFGEKHFVSSRVKMLTLGETRMLTDDDLGDISASVELQTDSDMRFIEIEEASERRVVERDADEDDRPATVLIAEDNPDITRLLHLALRKHFKVVAAPNGAVALDLVQRFNPQLIITDLMMPEVDGMELTKAIKSHPQYRHIPVLMLSARDGIESEMEAMGYPATAYMSKPFSTRKLSKLAISLAIDLKKVSA